MAETVDMNCEQALKSAFEQQLDAMRHGDTDDLGDLLDEGFSLTHITGYRQPKTEWLAQMRAGQFRYHAISVQSIETSMKDRTAVLTGRIIIDATVYGTRANWRLQLTLSYKRQSNGWIALRSLATTW